LFYKGFGAQAPEEWDGRAAIPVNYRTAAILFYTHPADPLAGNIPNIISASKLGIKSREWVRAALPAGAMLLLICFLALWAVY